MPALEFLPIRLDASSLDVRQRLVQGGSLALRDRPAHRRRAFPPDGRRARRRRRVVRRRRRRRRRPPPPPRAVVPASPSMRTSAPRTASFIARMRSFLRFPLAMSAIARRARRDGAATPRRHFDARVSRRARIPGRRRALQRVVRRVVVAAMAKTLVRRRGRARGRDAGIRRRVRGDDGDG